ncbi:MAG: DUF2764 domain-containing protein [Tannerellaceae bacterium]|jgi:hypothetical protein|nr:DUF2764 domain-containing protein [Tannerellaceae bacterium]
MGRYYYLIAGLPDIGIDDNKLPFTVSSFREETEEQLSPADKVLTDLFYRKFDNHNLLTQCCPEKAWDTRGSITPEVFEELTGSLRGEREDLAGFLSRHKRFPLYMIHFLRQYLEETSDDNKIPPPPSLYEDRLASLYYACAMTCGNAFVSQWFELNLNIRNLLSAFTARKYGIEGARVIVGDNEVAHLLRTSHARDFDLEDLLHYLPAVHRIAEETDLCLREKKIDQLRWEWLEEHTFFLTFDLESVFAYLCKLDLLERWVNLDKVTGEQTFRSLIGVLKKGGTHALADFRSETKR